MKKKCEICGQRWNISDYENYLEIKRMEVSVPPTLSTDIYSKYFNYCVRCYGRLRKGFLPTQIIEQLKEE